ncbi:MAG: hypothetical protein KAT68_11210 [Bacteroidales bacterium]|nr:hypothetical protein [Bacteroidales bacterium]
MRNFNPLYSYKNGVNCINVRWIRGSKAGNPALEEPKFVVVKNNKFVGTSYA